MSQYFAHQWATKQLWQDKFDYVFWLPLRNLTEVSKQENHSLAAVIYRECLQTIVKDPKEAEAVIQAIQVLFKTQSSRILLVLDGYDEVGHLMSDASHPVAKVLQEAFATEHFIVTSRPYHLYHTVPFDRRLENTGFTDDNIHQYIQHYFAQTEKEAKGKEVKGTAKATESSEKLQDFLQTNPALWGMAHIPINLMLVCDVWQQLQETDVVKEQLATTQLYQIIFDQLLRVYLKKNGKSVGDLYNATSEELQTQCVMELAFLQKIAFEAMQQGRVNLTPQLLQETANEVSKEHAQTIRSFKSKPVFESVLEMGLLRTVQASSGREIQKEHCFLHLTFQEYLAACYLKESLQLPDKTKRYQETIRFITDEKYNPRYQVLFGFLAGLVNRLEDTRVVFWNTILASPLDLTSLAHWRLVIRCLEETNCEARIPHQDAIFHSFADWIEKILKFDRAENLNKWLHQQLQLAHYPVFCKKSGLVEILVKALGGSDIWVRVKVVYVLGKLGEKGELGPVIEALLKALGDSDKEVRASAADALGNLGEKVATEPVIEALLKVLGDSDMQVRCNAAYALEKLGEKGATGPVMEALLKALLKVSGDDRNGLLTMSVAAALKKLGEKGALEPVIEALLKALGDSDSEVRRSVAYALGNLGEKVARKPVIEALLRALGDSDSEVRRSVAYALGNMGEKGATEPVIKALLKAVGNNNDSRVRETVAEALGNLGEKVATRSVIEALLKVLGDSDRCIRKRVFEALGKLGAKVAPGPVIEALLKALNNSEWEVRCFATSALKALGEKGATAPMIEALVKALGDIHSNVRGFAASALGALGERGAAAPVIEALLKALSNSDRNVRDSAASVFGVLGERGATAPVIEALVKVSGDSDYRVRSSAVGALGKLGEKGATAPVIEALVKALGDNEFYVGRSAAFALGALAEKDAKGFVIEALLKELNRSDKNRQVRREVMVNLASLCNKKVLITRINAERLLLTALKILDLEDDNEDIKDFFNAASFYLCPLMDVYHKKPHPFLPQVIAFNAIEQGVPFMLVEKSVEPSVGGGIIFYENGKRYEYVVTIAQQKELATAFVSALEVQGWSTVIPQAYLSGKPAFRPVLTYQDPSSLGRVERVGAAPPHALDIKDGATARDVVGAGSFKPKKDLPMQEMVSRIGARIKLRLARSPELKEDWKNQIKEQEKILTSIKQKLMTHMTSVEGKALFSQLMEEDLNTHLADAIAEEIVNEIADITTIAVKNYHIKDGIRAYRSKMRSSPGLHVASGGLA